MHSESRGLVIGLGGVSNGGKTTITNSLGLIHFPLAWKFHQDNYYHNESWEGHQRDPEVGINFDILSAFDMPRMLADIDRARQQRRLIIVEGILIFNDKELNQLFDKRYFFTLPREECQRRRSLRTYSPPEPPGYFDRIYWPMYEQHAAELKRDNVEVIYLDGESNWDSLLEQVKGDISVMLNEKGIPQRGGIIEEIIAENQ